ncbi:MAG TPA: mechanosensitive ion channel domain-containing protein [Ktedonobacteraceae bacterium]|nr:mechanosensitive ion channel domain-containing protein [Ktedonobacteraceae bacterium]
MAGIVLSVVLTILVVAVALGVAFWLRRLIVRRLKKTVLDNWLVQTIGALVTIPVIILGLLLVSLTVTMSVNFIITLWSGITAGLQEQTIANGIRALLWDFIVTILIIILAIGVGRTVMRLIVGRLGEQRLDINIRTLIGRIFYGLIVMVSVFWILSLWQVAIDVPIAVISALSVAFTFSIQDILKDLVAGLYILFERPFHIGEQITTATYTGTVENVELRATKIRLTSGEEITIPNALVFGGIVVNNSQFAERRASITLTMPQEEFDKDETPPTILDVVRKQENVLVKPEPHVFVNHYAGTFGGTTGVKTGYSGQIVVLTLRFWMPSGRYDTVTEVMSALHEALPTVDLLVEDSGGNV